MNKIKEFKSLWNISKVYKKQFIFYSLLLLINEFSCVLTGYLIGSATDGIVNLNLKKAMIYLIIYFFNGLLIDTFLYNYISVQMQKLENKISRRLELDTYKKALDLPAYAFEKLSSGEIINRISNDASTLSLSFLNIVELISSFIGTFIILVYVFVKSWVVGIEILLLMSVLYFIIKKYNPILINTRKERKKIFDKFSSITNESVRGIREIKTLGIKGNLYKTTTNINSEILDYSIKELDIRKKYRISTVSVKTILESLVFLTCAILLFYNKTDITFFIAMTYYIYRFTWLIERINSFSETFQNTYVSLSRVNEILENKLYDDDKFGNLTLNDINGTIEFKNVSFGYPDEELLLNNFNIKIAPNKKIAIVGESGQGKSTLFNLITRLFDPTKGKILIDGNNIEDLSEETLRKQISIIRQEPFIFNRTILENFKILDEDITLEEVRKYTKMAYIDDYIMSLPDKYDTLLGEGGVNLSGGQKQRIAIARTLLKNSKIILFDEATSALDNKSQEYIKKSIDKLSKNHTVIIVAHRLSTIIDADLIYVINNGKVEAKGTHKQLLKNSKIYKNLYQTESLNQIRA